MVDSPWKNQDKPEDRQKVIIDLSRSVQQEEDAILDYRARAELAGTMGDMKTVDVFTEIIADEEDHARKFRQRIRELGGNPD